MVSVRTSPNLGKHAGVAQHAVLLLVLLAPDVYYTLPPPCLQRTMNWTYDYRFDCYITDVAMRGKFLLTRDELVNGEVVSSDGMVTVQDGLEGCGAATAFETCLARCVC